MPRKIGHLKPQLGKESYFVYHTRVADCDSVRPSEMEIIDSMLLMIDNFASGCLQNSLSSKYMGERLCELGNRMRGRHGFGGCTVAQDVAK